MLDLTKNQRAEVMKVLAKENVTMSMVVNDGSTFDEGLAIGRIQVLMELLQGRPAKAGVAVKEEAKPVEAKVSEPAGEIKNRGVVLHPIRTQENK